MSTFNFGIGLQVEGNGTAGVTEFTAALNGLNASFQQISGNAPDFSNFAGSINDASQATEDAATANEHLAGSIQETGSASEEAAESAGTVTDAIEESTQGSITELERLRDQIRTAIAEELGRSAEEAAASFDELDEMVDEFIDHVNEVGDAGQEAGETFAEAFQDAVMRTSYELQGLASDAQNILGSLAAIFTGGQDVQIEQDLVRLSSQMGKGADAGRVMTDQVEALASANKLNALAVSASAQAIQRAGISYADLGEDAQRTSALMVDVLQMDPAAVADAIGGSKAIGASFTELADTSVLLGQATGVPGLVEQLPGAVDFAINAQIAFAGSVKKSGADITKNVQSMTAFYSKALGKDASKAAELAMGTFNRFAGAVSKNEDVFLGLSDEFDPMTNAMLEAGMSFEDAQAMLAKPLDTPEGQLEFVKSIKAAEESMDPQAYRRYYKQMMANADEGTQRLMTLSDEQLANADIVAAELANAAEAAEDPAVRAAKEQGKAMQAMADSMRDSVGGAMTSMENQVNNLVNTIQGAFRGDVKKGMEDAVNLFTDLIHWVGGLRTEFAPLLKEWGPFIQKIVMGAAVIGPALTGLSVALGPIQALSQGFGSLSRLAGSVVPGSLGVAAGAAATAALAVGLVAAGAEPAAESMRELSDASLMTKDSGEQMGTIFGSVLQGSLQTVDNLLGGYPSKLFGVTDGFAGVQTTVVDDFSNMPATVEKFFEETFTPDNLLAVGSFFAGIGENLLSALGHLPAALMNVFQGALNFIMDILGSVVKGVMKAFGADGSTIEYVNLFLDYTKFGFQVMVGTVRSMFNLMVEGIVSGLAAVADVIPGVSEEQRKALHEFAAGREEAVAADKALTAQMAANIETRKAKIDALALHEREVRRAGGEDAYRIQEQLAELRRVQEDRAVAAHPGVPKQVAIAMQQAEEQMQRQQAMRAQPAAPAATPAPITQPATTSATPEPPPSPIAGTAATTGTPTAPTTAPAAVGAATGAIPPPPAPAAPAAAARARDPTTVTLNFNNAHNSLAQGIMDWLKNAQTEAQIASLGGVH